MARRLDNRWSALVVLAAFLVPLVVLAMRSEGYHATQLDLNDAGIWTVNASLGSIGRINTQISDIEVRLPSPDAQDFDVSQVDDTVLLHLPSRKQVVPIDVALAKQGDPITLPDNGQMQIDGASAAVFDPASGKAWRMPRSTIHAVSPATDPAQIEAGPNAKMVVGVDGSVAVYAASTTVVHTLSVDGRSGTVNLSDSVGDPLITAVGSTPVVLDRKSAKLEIPGQPTVDLSSFGADPVLQQPGPVSADVLVATDTSLLAVPLGGGAVRTLTAAGTRSPTAPVWLDGCARGAWAGRPTYVQQCAGGAAEVKVIDNMGTEPRLEFRRNRGRVILNDMATGANLLFTPQDPIKVDNWNDALNRDDHQDNSNDQTVAKPKNFDCGSDAKVPELKSDTVGTRPGRPVIVKVLNNDTIPDCIVPQVGLVEASLPPTTDATVTVVNAGRDIQVTPAAADAQAITFDYQLTGTNADAHASVTVDVVPVDANHPPIPADDTTTVQAGKAVRINVLDNDIDPDGDALTLREIKATDGTVSFRSNGEVTYTPGGTAVGDKVLQYKVADEQGLVADNGKLTVTVLAPNAAPTLTAAPDQLNAFVGRETLVKVLANDSDTSEKPLTVSEVDQPAGLGVTWNEQGEVRVHPTEPGSTTFSYQMTDGDKSATGRIRVDAVAPGVNHPPVAVRDDLVVRPGLPALVDLAANDIDIDGDVLAVTTVSPPVDSGLSVELLDMHVVRVTASASFTNPVAVAYTVSDGAATSSGQLIVRPFRTAGIDQPPTAGADELNVRAGNITAIRALDNDIDPEGDRLTIISAGGFGPDGGPTDGETPLPPEQGRLFIEGEELRYQAPASGPLTINTGYTVQDPAGNKAGGVLTIHVSPADPAQNRPPTAPLIDARVFAGQPVTIKVPLVGLDPDGDPVGLIGVVDPPAMGQTALTADSFVYTADAGAAGTDTFTFTVRDSFGLEATGRIRVAVVAKASTNSDPVAVPDQSVVRVGETVSIPVLANDSDPDGDPVSLLTTGKDAPTKPRIGSVVIDPDGQRLDYTAPADAGDTAVSFSYSVSDGRGGSSRGVVTVQITVAAPPNAPPIVRDDFVKPQKPGSTVEVDVLANDRDPDGDIGQAKITVLDQPAATVVGGKIRVQLADTSLVFLYEVTDVGGAKAEAVVSIPVVKDLPPVCTTQAGSVKAGATITVDVLKSCSDPMGGQLQLVKVSDGSARGGTATQAGQEVSFAAAPQVLGDAGFSFVVSNGTSVGVGGVRLTVTGQDFPPTFDDGTVTISAGGERTIDLTVLTHDLNPEDKHTYEGLAGATDKVKAELSGTSLHITATDDAKGVNVALTFKVSDQVNPAVDARLTVQVQAYDGAPPTAVDDTAETNQGEPKTVNVTANDSDPLGKGLTVMEITDQQGGTAQITDPKGTIEFRPDPEFFGTATVTYKVGDDAKDSARTSTATLRVTVIGIPAKVSSPTSTSQESRKITLQWAAPAANGSPITGYVVKNNVGVTKECPSTLCVIDNLENATPYTFQVAARNKAVDQDSKLPFGDQSLPYTPDELPSAPATPTLKFGDSKITVSWVAPKDNGSPITTYLLKKSGPTNDIQPIPATSSTATEGAIVTYVWTGLQNGVAYDFSVVAKNAAQSNNGESPPSPWAHDATNGTPATVPGRPQNVNAVRSNQDNAHGGFITVSWDAPADFGGDSNLTYVITPSPADVAPITIRDAVPKPQIIGGFTNGTAYTFSITAKNKAGTGDAQSSPAAIPVRVPDAVTGITVAPGDRQATLTFSPPNAYGGTIIGWDVSTNGGAVQRYPASALPMVVQSLTNNASYRFTVTACSNDAVGVFVGCGQASAVTSPDVIPFGTPVAPSVTATINTTTITWDWSNPATNGNGRAITSYSLVLDGTLIDGAYKATSFSRTFSQDGQSHTLAVTATNAGGLTGPAGSAQMTDPPLPPPPPTPTVSVDFGNTASNCGFSPCNYMVVTWANFGAGAHTIHCHSGHGDGGFFAMPINGASGTTQTATDVKHQYCYVGTGFGYWVDVDGVLSNTINR